MAGRQAISSDDSDENIFLKNLRLQGLQKM